MKTRSPHRKVRNAESLHALFELSLKVIFRNGNGEVLILKANENSSMKGYYDFAGGRMHENERHASLRSVMRREIREEIGPKVRYRLNERPVALSRHTFRSPRTGIVHQAFWVVFEAQYLGGDIRLSSEHIGYRWIRLDKRSLSKYFVKGAYKAARHYLEGRFQSSTP